CAAAQNISTPKRTIQSGLTCLSPGDALYLRGGTYIESLTHGSFPAGSAWDAPVTIKGHPNETAVWQATPGCAYPDDCRFPVWIRSGAEQYIVFASIIFDCNNFKTNS